MTFLPASSQHDQLVGANLTIIKWKAKQIIRTSVNSPGSHRLFGHTTACAPLSGRLPTSNCASGST